MDTHITHLLSPYLEEEFNSPERDQVETHLSACASCREELSLLRKTAELVQSLPMEEPPADLLLQLNKRIDEDS